MRYRWTATTLAAAATVLALAGCHANDDASSAATSTPSVVVTKTAPSSHLQPSGASTADSGAADDAGIPETEQSLPRVEGRPVTAAPAPTGERGVDASVFFGTWTRHASHLELTSDLTGTLVMGSGAVDVDVDRHLVEPEAERDQHDPRLTDLEDRRRCRRSVLRKDRHRRTLDRCNGGATLLTNGLGSTGGPLTWCGASSAGTPECGA